MSERDGSDTYHTELAPPRSQFRKTLVCYTRCQQFHPLRTQTTAKKVAMFELFKADQSLDAGSTAAMADSSPPLATFFDISERNQARQPKLHVRTVERNLHGLPPEMDTCCTTNVSSEEATTKTTKFIGTAVRSRIVTGLAWRGPVFCLLEPQYDPGRPSVSDGAYGLCG